MAGHVIKTQEDFDIAEALWDTVHRPAAALDAAAA